MNRVPPQARLAVVVAAVLLVLGGAVYMLFLRGDGDEPVTEAGSRFGSEDEGGRGGTLIDTLAPVLSARVEAVAPAPIPRRRPRTSCRARPATPSRGCSSSASAARCATRRSSDASPRAPTAGCC